MKAMQFSVEIHATKEKVWNTLWQDETFRDWANAIDGGMYLVGNLGEGNEIQFMSPTGYGVTSLVEKFIPNTLVLFRHKADIKDGVKREKEWTGGRESYSLTESGGITTLTIDIDVPPDQEENFKKRLPRALERVKRLAEIKN